MEQTLTVKIYQDAQEVPRGSICVPLFQRTGAPISRPVACCHERLDRTTPLRFSQTMRLLYRQDGTNATLNHQLAKRGSTQKPAELFLTLTKTKKSSGLLQLQAWFTDASSLSNSGAVLKSGSPIHYSSKASHLPQVQPFKRTLPLSKPSPSHLGYEKLQNTTESGHKTSNNTLHMWLGPGRTDTQLQEKPALALTSSSALAKSATSQH